MFSSVQFSSFIPPIQKYTVIYNQNILHGVENITHTKKYTNKYQSDGFAKEWERLSVSTQSITLLL